LIRRFAEGDREVLADITALAFDGVSIDQNIERIFGPIAGTGWQWRKKSQIENDIAANPDGILVYEEDGRVLGYITTRVDMRTRIGWIPNMAVHPARQGRGIGKQLLQAALAYLRQRGMEYARIETLEQNTVGLRFYPSMGFKEVARQIHYIKRLE